MRQQHQALQRKFRTTGLIYIGLGLLAVLALFVIEPGEFFWVLALIGLVPSFVIGVLSLRRSTARGFERFVGSMMRKHPQDPNELAEQLCARVIQIETDGVRAEMDGCHAWTAWRRVRAIEVGELAVFLVMRNGTAYIIPKRVFEDSEHIDRVVAEVSARLAPPTDQSVD